MAKIFSTIAKTTKTLSERYADSVVNNDFTTFKSLRDTVSGDLVPSRLLITNRPKKVYDDYTDPRLTSIPLVKEYQESQLITKALITRSRRTAFYEAFRSTSSNQTATNPARNDTLVEIKPYSQNGENETYVIDTSRMLQNSQSLPLVSGPRDIQRMNRYFRTSDGQNFKVFQQLLQAGNTFGQSRSYNPASVENMVLNYNNANLLNPLNRVSRLIEGTAIRDSRLQGRLQKETVINVQTKLPLKFVGGSQPSQQSGFTGALNSAFGAYVQNRISQVNFNIGGRTFNVGQVGNALNALTTAQQALGAAFSINDATLVKDQTAYDALYLNNLWPLMKENDGTVKNFQGPQGSRQAYLDRARAAVQKTNFASINSGLGNALKDYPTDDYRSSADYTETLRSVSRGTPRGSNLTSARYTKDVFNLIDDKRITKLSDLQTAGDPSTEKDYVMFKIAVPGVPELANGIKFRAFISDLNHNARGQYEEVKYVGRPERFITYKGMNRNATFSMYLVAFSEAELNGIWARADMLNKLVFPIKDAGGFMVAPLVKLTIGNVFVDQPGYVENVDMKLTDIPWDIDQELPMAIQLTMAFNIIENSFITQQANSAELFNYAALNALQRANPQNGTGVQSAQQAGGAVAQATQPAGVGTGISQVDTTSRIRADEIRYNPNYSEQVTSTNPLLEYQQRIQRQLRVPRIGSTTSTAGR